MAYPKIGDGPAGNQEKEIVKARLELDAMAVCLEQLKGLPDREAQHRALTWLTARLDMGRLSYGD